LKTNPPLLNVLFVLLALTTCSCIQEPDLAFRSDVTGRWRVDNYVTSGTETLLSNDGTEQERQVSTTVTNNDLEITFSDNPARYYSEGTYTVNYQYEEDGELTSFSTSLNGIGQGSWSFDNGRLELISHQGAEIYQFDRVFLLEENRGLSAEGTYELKRIRTDQDKIAKLSVSFDLLPL